MYRRWIFIWAVITVCSSTFLTQALGAERKKKTGPEASPVVAAARQYAEAVASADKTVIGRLDFNCIYRLVLARGQLKAFPPSSDPYYGDCWDQLNKAHETAIQHEDQAVYSVWPGKGSLVFFTNQLTEYAPSFFVMDHLGLSPPAGGLKVEYRDSKKVPAASFRLGENAPLVAAPATMVRFRISYKDPLTSPVMFMTSPGTAHQFMNVIKSPRRAIRSVVIQLIVLQNLKKLGFPGDTAVLNISVEKDGAVIPFLSEKTGYQPESVVWWEAVDTPGLLVAAVGQAQKYPEQKDRIALLNRVLIIDPFQPEALTVLSKELYQTVLNMGATAHKLWIPDPALATRFNELYWNAYSQTTRTDISLGMQMGGRMGLSQPTAADYLYRLFPPMEKLAKVRPEDLENRLRLGIVYRWNNDQQSAIATHEALLKDVRPELPAFKARVLTELAWSRIAKVAWNRTFDDPGITQAYQEAEEGLNLTTNALDKFTAAYTMAYSLAFTPQRDNKAMLQHLTDAHHWYMRLPGSSQTSWLYLLGNDTLKGVVNADPDFKPLLASS
jgi:hypothetical protein